jgi:hypothetical protein
MEWGDHHPIRWLITETSVLFSMAWKVYNLLKSRYQYKNSVISVLKHPFGSVLAFILLGQ